MKTRTFFQRRHEKRVDLKAIERAIVSTLLIPKHLVEKLDLVLPVVIDISTMKKSYNLKVGLKKLLEKYRGFLASGFLPFQQKPKLTYQEEGLELQRFSFRPDDADWFDPAPFKMCCRTKGEGRKTLTYTGYYTFDCRKKSSKLQKSYKV